MQQQVRPTDNVISFAKGNGVITSKLQDTSRTVTLPYEWLIAYRDRGGVEQVKKESPSSVMNFIACPLAWYFDRHAPIEGAKFTPSAYSVTGDYAHRVLELFYGLSARERTSRVLDDIAFDVWDALDTSSLSGGIIGSTMIESYQYALDNPARNMSREDVEDFVYSNGLKCARAIEAFEDPATVEVLSQEGWVSYEANGITFRGKTDRVDIENCGSVVVDYKTGKIHNNTPGPRTLDDMEFFKSGMYALMEPHVHAVSQFYLKEEKGFRFKITDERLSFVSMVVDEVSRAMNGIEQDGRIPYRPSASQTSGHCRYCPIRQGCPAWNKASGGGVETIVELSKNNA